MENEIVQSMSFEKELNFRPSIILKNGAKKVAGIITFPNSATGIGTDKTELMDIKEFKGHFF